MSIVYLGKRPANTYGNRAKRVRADPALSISALVLAHLVSLLSSLFRVAFAILLLFGLVGSTVPLFVLLWRRKSSTLLSPTTPSTLLEWSP